MKTIAGLLTFAAFWAFTHYDASQENNLAEKAATAIVTSK